MYKDLSDDQRATVLAGIRERRRRVLAGQGDSWVAVGARGARRVAHAAPNTSARMADLLALGFRREDADLLLALPDDVLAQVLPSPELFFLAMEGGAGGENKPLDPVLFVRTLADEAGVVLPQGFGQGGQGAPRGGPAPDGQPGAVPV